MVVLGFISKERKRFHVFDSVRVQKIHDSTLRKPWRYVESEQNPADEASPRMKAGGLPDSPRILGPEFFWSERTKWFECDEQEQTLRNDDPEVTKISRYGDIVIKPKIIYSRGKSESFFKPASSAKSCTSFCKIHQKIKETYQKGAK